MDKQNLTSPDRLERNKDVCRQFLINIAALHLDKAQALLHPDVLWWVQGKWPGAGFHQGKLAVSILFDQIKSILASTMDIEFGMITAENNRVALEMRSRADIVGGREYKNTYHYLFVIKDDLILSAKEYLDTDHLIRTLRP